MRPEYLPPVQELTEASQHLILFLRLSYARSFLGYDEWNCVHAKARNTQLQPETHDFQNLCLYLGIRRVQVWLKIIKAVEVIGFSNLIMSPG